MKKSLLLPVLCLLTLVITADAQIRFSANTERTNVTVGEQVVVTATLSSNKNIGSPGVPHVESTEQFSLLKTDRRQSSSSSIQIINGKAVQKNEINTQFYYVITPRATGSFTFPSIQIELDGTIYKTDPLVFNVTNEPVKNPDIQVSLLLNKRNLYVGEQADFTFKIVQKANSPTEVRNSFMPALEKLEKAFGKDFSLSRLFTTQITTTQERIYGEIYNTYSLKYSLFPVSAGTFQITSVPFEYQELKRAQRRRVDPFFDDFFDMDFLGGGMQAVAKIAHSNSLSINVKALPPAPAGFTGAVGNFSISASADRSEVPSGEAVTLKVTLKGSTRPSDMGDVNLAKLADCEIFKPERQVSADTTARGISAKKFYKYLLIPRQEGNLVIPPVTFPYFDPETGTYKTISSDPININVTRGKDGGKPQTRYLTQEEIREVGQDIRYIKTNAKISNQEERPYREPVFFLLFPLPLIIALVSILYRYQAASRQKNAPQQIRRRAVSLARKNLSTIRKTASRMSPSEFLGKVSETIERFISEKFGFPATGRTLDELKAELLKNCSDEKIVSDLAFFIEYIDSYRFGGKSLDDKTRNELISKSETFITGLESVRKKEKVSMSAAILLMVAGLLAAAQAAPVASWFEKANQFYADQQYDSASTYYEKIVQSGVNNSTVYYNFGNACYRLKKIGLARLYFEKAARLAPGDQDITTNIRFVNSNIVDRIQEPQRGFLENIIWQMHILLSLKAQLWLSFCLLFAISVLISSCFYLSGNARLWLIYLSVLLALCLSLVGLSMGFKIYELEKVSYAIVLSPSTDARNQPDGNKILFTAHEGTKFRIRKTEGAWSLVNLPNGFSGWVENKDLGKI
ncbi:MAG: hypothetical protein GX556_11045 [Fibrobacter sp.]|nr:hypothetical protein [Fibrobacter sp.]